VRSFGLERHFSFAPNLPALHTAMGRLLKISLITIGIVAGGHALVTYVTPSEKDLLARFSPAHRQQYLATRQELRDRDAALIEQAKHDLDLAPKKRQ
jgi:hypothetical protein